MSRLYKIVIIGDSLALPRPAHAGLVRYEETYPVVLQRELQAARPDVEVLVAERGQRFRTMTSVVQDWTEVVEYRKPDVAIVHVGIVDCAPRIFTQAERSRLERLRPAFVRRRILALAGRLRPYFVRLRKPVVYTGLAEFEAACRQVVECAKASGVRELIVVNILRPTPDLEQRSPGYTRNCGDYNAVLTRVFEPGQATLLDFDGIVQRAGGTEALTGDGMHPNPKGHALLARALCELVAGKIPEAVA